MENNPDTDNNNSGGRQSGSGSQGNIQVDTREISPQGRYIRLEDKLGAGAYKDVWRAYDTSDGIEVAWNVVKLNRIPPAERKRIKTEVKLLKDIQHKNVIRYYNSWVDREKEQIIFVTEMMSSGSLKHYLRKNTIIRWNAVKKWCKQILTGLEFLHANHIIHRDIKCDNIFINGTTGDLRIGDLGLSTRITEERSAMKANNSAEIRQITAVTLTCLGTPEFMAPEMYEESYDEKVDIYAFGMCVIEMVTGLIPYHHCTSAAQVYKKVMSGELPPELDIVQATNPRAAEFVRLCLNKRDNRPNATELLTHDFLQPNTEEDYKEVRSRGKLLEMVINEVDEEDDDDDDDDLLMSTPSNPNNNNNNSIKGTTQGLSSSSSQKSIPVPSQLTKQGSAPMLLSLVPPSSKDPQSSFPLEAATSPPVPTSSSVPSTSESEPNSAQKKQISLANGSADDLNPQGFSTPPAPPAVASSVPLPSSSYSTSLGKGVNVDAPPAVRATSGGMNPLGSGGGGNSNGSMPRLRKTLVVVEDGGDLLHPSQHPIHDLLGSPLMSKGSWDFAHHSIPSGHLPPHLGPLISPPASLSFSQDKFDQQQHLLAAASAQHLSFDPSTSTTSTMILSHDQQQDAAATTATTFSSSINFVSSGGGGEVSSAAMSSSSIPVDPAAVSSFLAAEEKSIFIENIVDHPDKANTILIFLQIPVLSFPSPSTAVVVAPPPPSSSSNEKSVTNDPVVPSHTLPTPPSTSGTSSPSIAKKRPSMTPESSHAEEHKSHPIDPKTITASSPPSNKEAVTVIAPAQAIDLSKERGGSSQFKSKLVIEFEYDLIHDNLSEIIEEMLQLEEFQNLIASLQSSSTSSSSSSSSSSQDTRDILLQIIQPIISSASHALTTTIPSSSSSIEKKISPAMQAIESILFAKEEAVLGVAHSLNPLLQFAYFPLRQKYFQLFFPPLGDKKVDELHQHPLHPHHRTTTCESNAKADGNSQDPSPLVNGNSCIANGNQQGNGTASSNNPSSPLTSLPASPVKVSKKNEDEWAMEMDENLFQDLLVFPEFQELYGKYRDQYQKMMKDCVQKFSSLQSQREKTKETFTKDFEQLHLRRSDLDRQFDSIQIKYKERMADFSARKTQAVEEHIEKCAAAAAATAGNNSSSLDKGSTSSQVDLNEWSTKSTTISNYHHHTTPDSNGTGNLNIPSSSPPVPTALSNSNGVSPVLSQHHHHPNPAPPQSAPDTTQTIE